MMERKISIAADYFLQTNVFIECAPKTYASMTSPKLRAPRCCQKCHGAPLQSQCMHTKAGRLYQVCVM